MQLERQAVELLPLAADGKTAALPEGAERTRWLLLAILLVASTTCVLSLRRICSTLAHTWEPACQPAWKKHSVRMLCVSPAAWYSSWHVPAVVAARHHSHAMSAEADPLERALVLYAFAGRSAAAHWGGDTMAGVWGMLIADSAARLIEVHEEALNKSLADLAAGQTEKQSQPLLTVCQLLHACCCRSALAAGMLLSGLPGKQVMLTPTARAFVQVYANQACGRALALEPDSPSTCLQVAK